MNKRTIIKGILAVVGFGVSIAKDYLDKKDFDEKVAEAVTEQIAKSK